MDIKAAFNQPFPAAISYFENKLKLPTASYTDIYREQHAHAFVVAGATADALVEDFYNALHKALNEGTGLKQFQADFDQITTTHGWSHHGSAGWRSKLIYDTNIRQAYNAGKYAQMISVMHLRPYWVYRHHSIVNPRVEHQFLDNLILAADNPRWEYIMPQNGYGCQCTVDSMSQLEANDEFKRQSKTGLDETPAIRWEEKTIGTTGSNPRTVKVPIVTHNGKDTMIDPGFAYNPGKAWLEPHTMPPLTGYDAVLKARGASWPTSTPRPALPTLTPIKPTALLPVTTAPEVAAEEFLNTFGADLQTGAVFEDVVNQPIAITKRLFADETGSFAAMEAKTIQAVNLLAMALAEPDEVWWHWEQDNNPNASPDAPKRWRLKRRYLRLFKLDGKADVAITAFEWCRSKGWVGDTAFTTVFESEIDPALDNWRVGKLVYKKGEK